MRLTLLFILCSSLTVFAQDLTPSETDANGNSIVLPAAIWECGCGMEAHYAGGKPELSKFVNDHIHFPQDIQWGDVTHVRTYVQFIVEEDGSLTDVHVTRTNFPEMNESILNIFDKMTNWVAGEYDCRATRTRVRVPISVVIR